MATIVPLIGREFYVLPKVAKVITEVFPNEDVSGHIFLLIRSFNMVKFNNNFHIKSLNLNYNILILDFSAMTQNAALSINMGSPFTGDGLRPILPNVIRGKNCYYYSYFIRAKSGIR